MNKSSLQIIENFLSSFGTAVSLSRRAKKNRHFIELVCLNASIIDGLLRLTLVFKNQIESSSDFVDQRLIYQAPNDKKLTERHIYEEALKHRIITKELFRRLNKLYDNRNRVIHRYVISDIKHFEVMKIAKDYEILLNEIAERHRKYHNKLKALGIGMSKYFIDFPNDAQIEAQIRKKMR